MKYEKLLRQYYKSYYCDQLGLKDWKQRIEKRINEEENFALPVINTLQEIHRLLSPEGVAIISTPIRLTEQPIDKMHVFEWFESEFQEMIL